MKTTLFGILFALAGLAGGCTSEKNSLTAETAAAEPRAPKITVVKKIKIQEMDPLDKQLHIWTLSLRKSHEVFREVWAHVWEDRLQAPMSVFSEIERQLKAHKNPENGHFRALIQDCPSRATQIEILQHSGKINGAVFYQLGCGSKTGRNEMARVMRVNGHDEWTFYAENMTRGAGLSLSLLKERTRCRMELDGRERLNLLDCQNLGQNRDTETHLLFSQFRYQKGADTLVLVEGKKYRLLTTAVCDNPKFCTRLRVPLSGRIEIFEDQVSQVAREERQRIQDQKERQEELKEAREKHEKAVAEMRARVQSVQKAQMSGGTHVTQPGGPPSSVVPAHHIPVLTPHGQVTTAAQAQAQAEGQERAEILAEENGQDQAPKSVENYDFSQVVRPGQALPPEFSQAEYGLQRMEFGHDPRAATEQAQREGYLPGMEESPREAQQPLPER